MIRYQRNEYEIFSFFIPKPSALYSFNYYLLVLAAAVIWALLVAVDYFGRLFDNRYLTGIQELTFKDRDLPVWAYETLSAELDQFCYGLFIRWPGVFTIYVRVSNLLTSLVDVFLWPFLLVLFFSYFFSPFVTGEYLLLFSLFFTFFFLYDKAKPLTQQYFESIWLSFYNELGEGYFRSLLTYSYAITVYLKKRRTTNVLFGFFTDTLLEEPNDKGFRYTHSIFKPYYRRSMRNQPGIGGYFASYGLLTHESFYETLNNLEFDELIQFSESAFEEQDISITDNAEVVDHHEVLATSLFDEGFDEDEDTESPVDEVEEEDVQIWSAELEDEESYLDDADSYEEISPIY